MVSWKLQPRFNFITLSWTWLISNHWQIEKFSFQWSWTWTWMWTRSLILWFSSKFRIIVDSGILLYLDPILELTLILIPIDLEHEPPILDSHIPLLRKECESQFFDLNSTIEPKPNSETKLDLSHIPESVLVLIPFIPKLKSSILQNHILFLDQDINHKWFRDDIPRLVI